MHIGSSFFGRFGFPMAQQFGWANQMGGQLAQSPTHLGQVRDSFGFAGCMSPWQVGASVQYGAMPDLYNSGRLDVDKQKGVVTSPGGYKVSVNNGRVRIQSPNGKFTDLKAEPPTQTVQRTARTVESRTIRAQLPDDPVVRESDGDVWRYQGTGSFQLPDGTKITVQEAGAGKDLHINQVDIYNGNKHVAINSQLESSKWKTVNSKVLSQTASAWQNAGGRTQDDEFGAPGQVQNRNVNTRFQDTQVADQKFKTTFSDVRRDGYLHDMLTSDGQRFQSSGDGDDWRVNGREVMSGGGKGKDDPTKAYQLGGHIPANWQGARPVEMPYNVYGRFMLSAMPGLFGHERRRSPEHWQNLSDGFRSAQTRGHLGVSSMGSAGSLASLYGGPVGGAALYGAGYRDGVSDAHAFQAMHQSVGGAWEIFDRMENLMASFDRHRYSYANHLSRARATGMRTN